MVHLRHGLSLVVVVSMVFGFLHKIWSETSASVSFSHTFWVTRFKSCLKMSCVIPIKGNVKSYSLQPSCFLGFADVLRMLTLHLVLSCMCMWTMSSPFWEIVTPSKVWILTGRTRGEEKQTELVPPTFLLKHQACVTEKVTSISTCWWLNLTL